jgi:2-(1,2-epoxy-1,2-dihydrophenyl)acetyl-CoA isomerase
LSDDSILVERDGGVVKLTLNRPEKLNSFNAAMHRNLAAALDRVEADASVRALLLTGAGRGFCAGQDLSDRATAPGAPPPDLSMALDTAYNPLIRRLRALAMPVIVAVNGVAAGAGANIALAGDLVFAARSAKFIQSFCRIGLIPDCGGTWLLPRLLGRARAAGLALLGEALSAEQAAAWGLIWKMVEDDALAEETMALARHLATQPTKGLAAIKRALNASWSNTLDAQLDLERDTQRELGKTDDYREGVAAFLAKRPPRFKGT